MKKTVETVIGGKPLSITTGKVAKQASGAVVVQHGDTIVLVTVVSSQEERSSDFLPLTVEYQEKIYAAGRIPGNYFRREIGRPTRKGNPHCAAHRPPASAPCFPRVTGMKSRSSRPFFPWTRKTIRTPWP
jgi:polyribonucleotide nucleotidyltransferase